MFISLLHLSTYSRCSLNDLSEIIGAELMDEHLIHWVLKPLNSGSQNILVVHNQSGTKTGCFFKHVIINCYETMFCTIFYIPALQYGSKDYKSKSNSVQSMAKACEQRDKHMSKGTPL